MNSPRMWQRPSGLWVLIKRKITNNIIFFQKHLMYAFQITILHFPALCALELNYLAQRNLCYQEPTWLLTKPVLASLRFYCGEHNAQQETVQPLWSACPSWQLTYLIRREKGLTRSQSAVQSHPVSTQLPSLYSVLGEKHPILCPRKSGCRKSAMKEKCG